MVAVCQKRERKMSSNSNCPRDWGVFFCKNLTKKKKKECLKISASVKRYRRTNRINVMGNRRIGRSNWLWHQYACNQRPQSSGARGVTILRWPVYETFVPLSPIQTISVLHLCPRLYSREFRGVVPRPGNYNFYTSCSHYHNSIFYFTSMVVNY